MPLGDLIVDAPQYRATSRQRRSSPLETLDVTSLVLRRCGAGVWVPWCGDTKVPRLEYALELMFCMPSQHHAIGLQTGCMVTVLAPVVEAARLPRVCPMALGYGKPPCNNNTPQNDLPSPSR